MPEAYGARHPRVRELRALTRDPRVREAAAACVVEGPRVIDAALDRDATLTHAYLGLGARKAFGDLVDRLVGAGVTVVDLKEGVLEKVGTTRTPQPVLAVASWRPAALADVPATGLIVVLVDLADPGNLGTILRSAEAAGAAGVVVTGESVDVRNPKVVRASAGAVFGIPVAVAPDTRTAFDALRATGRHCLAAVATGGCAPAAADLGGNVAVLLGNEARGLDAELLSRCDGAITIPMAGAAESLNVAMAATVLCFEAARQRGAVAP